MVNFSPAESAGFELGQIVGEPEDYAETPTVGTATFGTSFFRQPDATPKRGRASAATPSARQPSRPLQSRDL